MPPSLHLQKGGQPGNSFRGKSSDEAENITVADGPIIELATLPSRHPKIGDPLLDLFGAQLVLRLGFDSRQQPTGTRKREVTIDRIASTAGGVRQTEVREIGWEGLPKFSEDYCIRVARTSNEQDITEAAAIAVMGLLIHELEGVSIESVLPIGSGGDYLVKLHKNKQLVQVEVSGIREDLAGDKAATRLGEKRTQVLNKSASGYVSVTTFYRVANGGPHSFLHYVEKRNPKRAKGRKPNEKRRGK